MYNKKALFKATAELDKAKAPKKPKDIITDPMGQWKYPGEVTRIPSDNITMKGVGYPVVGVANTGQRQTMLPGADYTFPGADYVDEYPQMQDNIPHEEDGGYIELDLTEDEIEEYRKGGFIVEDISVPELNQAQKGKTVKNKVLEISDPKEFAYRKALYDDSLQLHKQALKQTNFGLKPISKEKYEEIGNWEHQQPDYVFADKEYKKDLKNKKIKDFDDYVFDIKDPKNKKRTDEHFKQYANNFEDFAITLSDGSIKTPGFIDNGKPDFEYYDLYNPKTGTLKSYAGKELLFIDNHNMKPEKILYYGADKPDYSSVISTESVSKEYTNKVLKNSKSKNKKYVSPHWMSSQTSFYKKPTQPVKFNKNAEKPVVIDRETVANEPIVNKSKTGDSKIINKINTTNYPEGYQPYSLYGRVLDPEVYGYAKSINGKPVEAAQFGDTYGYKAKMDEYKKSGKYPWVKQEGGLIQAQEGLIATKEHTDKKGNKTIVVTKEDGTKYTKVIDSKGKVHNKIQPGMHPAMQDYFKKKAEWERRSSGAAQPVDDFWTLPIGMTSAGVKGAGALVKGTVAAVKGAGKSSLAQATKAGSKALFNTAPKWAPGMNLGNAIGAGFAGNALTDVVTGKVAEPWKKANKSGKGSDYADAVTETLYTAMDAIPLYGAVGKTAKQLGKYAKVKGSTKKLIPSIQASAVGETNSFVPNNLIHHPDNTYILQKTPVKDFGIKLNIKNKPDKSKHGFDVSDDEIKQVINQNLEYINHPEYIKRRQATTGESVEKIKKEIKDYTESLKHAKFDFDKVAVKNGLGAHQRGIKILGKNLVNPKITVNSSDKAIKTKYDFLHVLDHEVKHALSPVSKNAFTAFPKYKNYPHVDLVKSGNKSVYNSADYEQQVRFLRIRDHLHNKFGISKHKELSPEEWDVFKNEWNGWLKEEHIGLGNKRVPRGLKDVRGMMELKHPKVSSEQLRKIINKSWAIAPVGIAGAAVNYMPGPKKSKQMQEGGMITKLTPKEIQDYINQGYIVEEH